MYSMADPYFIYGTAWKTSATKTLVKLAIEKGFRAIDTANQPKHYTEDLVGEALAELRHEGYIQREDLFLQTKFTPVSGQDARIPYDPDTSIKTQVLTSFQSSLTHLQTDYLDAYLLHGPYGHLGLTEDDWSVWETLEQIHLSGKAKKIGVSNFNTQQLAELTQHANIKPMILQ